jgi:hypothetical protein
MLQMINRRLDIANSSDEDRMKKNDSSGDGHDHAGPGPVAAFCASRSLTSTNKSGTFWL